MRRPLRSYLLRVGRSPASALTQSALQSCTVHHIVEGTPQLVDSLSEFDVGGLGHGDALVVAFEETSGPPWWQELLATELGNPEFAVGVIPTRGAIVFCLVQDPNDDDELRWIAWTFGTGSRHLDRTAFEPRFGVISALNRIIGDGEDGEALLRKLQYRQQGAYRQRVGHVASSDIPLGGFRIDRVRDLLAAAGGKPPGDNAQVFGSRNLVYRIDMPSLIDTVRDESTSVLGLFRDDKYKSHFGFIDNYLPVDDPELIEELRAGVIDDIVHSRDTVDVGFPDDLVDFNDERSIEFVLFPNERVSQASRKTLTVDMLAGLLADNPEEGIEASLRFLDADGDQLGRVALHECIVAETVVDGERYYLTDGTYYHVSAGFIQRLDQELDEIPSWEVLLPRYDGGREDEWNTAVAGGGHFLMLDKTRVTLPGETPFEPADLIHESGAFIHAKRKGRSSALSYLFVQANTSCQMLSNPEAVDQLRGLVEEHGEGDLRDSVRAALVSLDQTRPDLEVVLAILGDWHERTIRNLPLIAKLELQATVRSIEQRGFRPRVALVNLTSRP